IFHTSIHDPSATDRGHFAISVIGERCTFVSSKERYFNKSDFVKFLSVWNFVTILLIMIDISSIK
ncbi:MAG: hypothetical protein ACPGHY_07830, partial [Paracoccaceae bacterium]